MKDYVWIVCSINRGNTFNVYGNVYIDINTEGVEIEEFINLKFIKTYIENFIITERKSNEYW